MKKLFVFITLCCTVAESLAQTSSSESYSFVRIHLKSNHDTERLQRLGFDLDHARGKRHVFVETFVQPHELVRLAANGFTYDILIADWDQHYAAQQKVSQKALTKPQAPDKVKGFRLGSMGGYYTFAEIAAALDSMRRLYPQLISQKASLGKTVENRDIWMVKISSNPGAVRDKPEVFYNALIHAREPEGMAVLMYFMFYLLERYGSDPEATYLLDNRELYFAPVLNPDGYVYNQTTRPDGGGLWRKNRRVNTDNSVGVDLNRNFGFKWGVDDVGSSGVPANGTYRGVTPFSEPELQAVRDFCRRRNFRVAINYHTSGNLFIYPFGYQNLESADSLLFRDFAREATRQNNYTYGTAAQTVNYIANGVADDWMYGEQSDKPQIISSTIEVGESFWPLPARIIPLAEENLYQNLHAAWIAGAYVVPISFSRSKEFPQAGDTITIGMPLQNKGLAENAAQLAVEFSTISPHINWLTNRVELNDLSPQQTTRLPPRALRFVVRSGYKEGELVTMNVKIHQNGGAITRAYTFQLGAANLLLADDAETASGLWQFSGGWGRDSSFANHGKFSFKELPYANSQNNAEGEMTLSQSLDFTKLSSARLEFHTKYAIESGSDFGQVLGSRDGGRTWQALKGALMGYGLGNLPQGYLEPGYDGIRHEWEKEEINLDNFVGRSNVLLKFRFRSNGAVNWRGWYVDNIRVIGYAAGTTAVAANNDAVLSSFALEQNYPNPLQKKSAATIRFSLPQRSRATLKIMDVLGREIAILRDGWVDAGNHTAIFNPPNLPSGIYFYQLTAGGFIARRKMLLVQ